MTVTVYTPARQRLCAEAEAALCHALDTAGHLVTSDAILAAWTAANKGLSPPDALRVRWHWVFAPAATTGRIIRRQRLFGLRGHPASEILPPAKPCRYGKDVLERCAMAEGVVTVLVQERSRMVSAIEVSDAWRRVTGSEPPAGTRNRLERYLDPAIKGGQIRVVQKVRMKYFGPAAHPELQPPDYASDLQRAEEALRRAVTRLRSAVMLGEIQQEIDADPALSLQSTRLLLANNVGTLVRTDRCRLVRHVARYHDAVRYYSTPGGPWWVRSPAEHHLDRRWRAVCALWEASGARPFTTRALRLYACSRPGLRIENDPPYAWTNALHLFMHQNALVRIGSENSHFVRWAPAKHWESLTPEVRAERLRDAYRLIPDDEAHPEAAAAGLNADTSPFDTGFSSRNQDIRYLVLMAKAIRTTAEPTECRRTVLRSRPVSLSDIARAAERRPDLARMERVPLRTCLAEASRLRPEMRKTAIAFIGRVANRAFYDVKESPAAVAYVAFRAALRGASPSRFKRILSDLRKAAWFARTGMLPLAEGIIDARASKLLGDLRDRSSTLERAANAVALLPEEAAIVRTMLDTLAELKAETAIWTSRQGTDPAPSARETRDSAHVSVDSAAAFASISNVAEFKLNTPRRLAWYSPLVGQQHTVDESLTKKRTAGGTRGRPVEIRVDTASFIAYATARWAGIRSATLTSTALLALGDLRDPAPFVEALENDTRPSVHPAAAAALGLLNDHLSRDCLSRYLIRNVTRDGSHGPGTCVPAAEFAICGLGPLPFGTAATSLRDHERTALETTARDGADSRLRATARMVLRAWDEEHIPGRLMDF